MPGKVVMKVLSRDTPAFQHYGVFQLSHSTPAYKGILSGLLFEFCYSFFLFLLVPWRGFLLTCILCVPYPLLASHRWHTFVPFLYILFGPEHKHIVFFGLISLSHYPTYLKTRDDLAYFLCSTFA
ncbi:uncharacterized protein BDV14DRAFT_43415 [Aspergillus stella-maris]|uniref:uncharacterized protein n=1 Tax=Aspergillus stella-maris TaxID=1810926 RepID=UPI003CCD3422